jgi:hypothetical protein
MLHRGAARTLSTGLALVLAVLAMAQGRFTVNGRLKVEGGSMDGCRMVIYKDGEKYRTVTTDLNRFSLDLELNSNYVLSFEKQGFVTKKLSFNTAIPSTAAQTAFTPFEFVVSIFKQYDGVNTVVFNQPVGMIRYDRNLADFDYDTDYTKSIQSALESAQQQVEQKQQEEKKANDDLDKEKARAAKEKAKADARAAKEAEAKAKEAAKAKEKEQQQAQAKTPEKKPAPPPPAPVAKREAPKPKPAPRPVVKASLPPPVQGSDVRQVSTPRVVTEESPVEPAQAHVATEPKPKFEPTPVVRSRHQDVIVEPNQVITVIRLETGTDSTEYRKVIRKYSGTYYFKNGASCSRQTYEREALAEVR